MQARTILCLRRFLTVPGPLIPLVLGILAGKSANKTKAEEKEQFQAVKGRKRKDGTIGKAYVRTKPKAK